MPEKNSPNKNCLSIRLSESAVFLRTDAATGRRRNVDAPRTSILRGLLTLELVKPTKITSIDIELQATTSTAWPEGIGARRIEVTEQHRVFHASTVYFCAGKTQSRRTASIGPGVTLPNEEFEEHDWDDPLSYTPRGNEMVVPADAHDNGGTSWTAHGSQQYTLPTHYPYRPNRSPTPPPVQRNQRRVSVDSPNYQRLPVSHHEEYDAAPIPPYSPQAVFSPVPLASPPPIPSASSSCHLLNPDGSTIVAAQNLEEFRNSLHSSLSSFRQSPSSPMRSHQERSLSRRPSMDDVPEHESGPSTSQVRSPTPPQENGNQARGRRGSRFGFSSVSNVLINAVRSSSPQLSPKFQRSRERNRSEDVSNGNRGRTTERAFDGNERISGHGSPSTSITRSRAKESKERGLSIGNLFGKATDEKAKDNVNGWKEFKKGTYTYPISFPIPGNAPPTMQCDYGSVVWRLRATAHRPGTFKSKLTASREVIMIACPMEEDTEDTENIVVERHWDQQLQYLISISGRSFYIGGTVPVTFTLMPLAKVKIHRVSVFIEERVDYYTNMRRIARSDPVTRVELLSIKGEGKGADPILPLESDEVEAFRKSPLFSVLDPQADISEVASSVMGPGPWTFHQDLKLPSSCGAMRFTNRNRRSNIIITHLLKCVLRVERGDDVHIDGKTGKKRLFDIVVQTPVHILSCRCNPEWTSLPRYSEALDDPTTVIPNCPCHVQRMRRAEQTEYHPGFRYNLPAALERMASRQSSDSSASAAETHPVNPAVMRTLRHNNADLMLNTNSQFERLISGQETEMGEAPPAYVFSPECVLRVA